MRNSPPRRPAFAYLVVIEPRRECPAAGPPGVSNVSWRAKRKPRSWVREGGVPEPPRDSTQAAQPVRPAQSCGACPKCDSPHGRRYDASVTLRTHAVRACNGREKPGYEVALRPDFDSHTYVGH